MCDGPSNHTEVISVSSEGINLEHRKTFYEINFLRLIHPKIFLKEVQSDDVQRNREADLGDPKVKTSLTSEDGQNYGAIPMPTFAPRPLTTNSTILVLIFRRILWLDSKDRKCRNYSATGSLIHSHS